MKEATGELNMTVVTVVAIAAVAAFFYAVVWPGIKKSIERNQKCANAVCQCDSATTGMCNQCYYINDNGASETISCPMQGDSTTK